MMNCKQLLANISAHMTLLLKLNLGTVEIWSIYMHKKAFQSKANWPFADTM